MIIIRAPWAMEQKVLEQELQSNASKGLTSSEAEKRLKEAGENKITQSRKLPFGKFFGRKYGNR